MNGLYSSYVKNNITCNKPMPASIPCVNKKIIVTFDKVLVMTSVNSLSNLLYNLFSKA